ncbi:MAG: hypothetical protein IT547_14315 [Hyphomonadaceae bacterium]|jgi:hypothetical protein|nr:hypothetical protein [Hyphomonadaceae bacterium]
MPAIGNVSVDATALMALGFLVAVLATSMGLFVWLMRQGGKRPRRDA